MAAKTGPKPEYATPQQIATLSDSPAAATERRQCIHCHMVWDFRRDPKDVGGKSWGFRMKKPSPASSQKNHMRWIVMAQSKVFMTINYAVMVEVQKALTGYRLKLQYDSRALRAS